MNRENGVIMAMGSTSLKVAKVASVASFALLMSTGIVATAQASTTTAAKPASTANSCKNVGGGTWCYGSGASGIWKGCYSNYVHPTNYHSSTASIAGNVDKRYNSAGNWSQAFAEAGWAYTCYTYYNPNA